MNATEKVRRAIKKEYLPKLDDLWASVEDGLLTVEEAQASAAGALLNIWNAAGYEPATAMGKHDCALYNAQSDLESRWGGARPGAGRPNLADESTVEGTISLPQSLDAKAKRLGDGNRSAGIRKALQAWQDELPSYDLRYAEILVGCHVSDSFPQGGNEWTNAAGRICAHTGQSNWGGNDSRREIIAWGTDGIRKGFQVPWSAEDITKIRSLIAE